MHACACVILVVELVRCVWVPTDTCTWYLVCSLIWRSVSPCMLYEVKQRIRRWNRGLRSPQFLMGWDRLHIIMHACTGHCILPRHPSHVYSDQLSTHPITSPHVPGTFLPPFHHCLHTCTHSHTHAAHTHTHTLSPHSEALPFFLLLIDLSKASALAKFAFKSRTKVNTLRTL